VSVVPFEEASTIAIGVFDGVHARHRDLIATAEPPVVVVTWESREGERLLSPVKRRLELLADAGAASVVVALEGEGAVDTGEAVVVYDSDTADPAVQRAIRTALAAGDVGQAAQMLGRPPEVEGEVVGGDARGRTLGFPTANVQVEAGVVVPALGIYAGWAAGTLAAVSIGTNPTYGGDELRVEAFLLDFEGDLYGQRLVIELWERLRDEAAFSTEAELVEAIERDVARTREATRPT
jgi:riboflavin kinase/FMN adenylyltransferase